MKKQLHVDLEINIEEEEKELEEAGKIDDKKLMLYNFAENLESAEQEELIEKLQEMHPSLKKAKMMETVFLQLLLEVKEIDIICQMLVACLDNMDNGFFLKKSLQEKECGSKTCPVHALARFGFNIYFYHKFKVDSRTESDAVLKSCKHLCKAAPHSVSFTFCQNIYSFKYFRTESYARGPGICIIINQKIFSKRNSDLEDRHGTDKY